MEEGTECERLELRYGHVKVLSRCQQTAGSQTQRPSQAEQQRVKSISAQIHICRYIATRQIHVLIDTCMRGLSCHWDKNYFCLFLHRSLVIVVFFASLRNALPVVCCFAFSMYASRSLFAQFVTAQFLIVFSLVIVVCIAFNCWHFMQATINCWPTRWIMRLFLHSAQHYSRSLSLRAIMRQFNYAIRSQSLLQFA